MKPFEIILKSNKPFNKIKNSLFMKNLNKIKTINFLKNSFLLCVLIFILQLVLLGSLNAQPNSVFGGTPIDITEAPYQVALIKSNGGFACGGSIINEEWILTAAHCVQQNTPSSWRIQAGVSESNNVNIGQIYDVDQIIYHPDWNGSVYHGGDLALLHLTTPICYNNKVQPITFATPENTSDSDIAPGIEVFFSGWGDYGDVVDYPSTLLRGASLLIIFDDDAFDILSNWDNTNCPRYEEFGSYTISAFKEDSGISGGSGDSGGPAVITKSDGSKLLVGVTSSAGCPDYANPTVFMDVRYFSLFIQEHITPSSQCSCPNKDVHINENTLFSEDMEMAGNIIVHSGVELLIESKIGMREGTFIHVERNARLVVDNGGIVTKGCNAPDWGGI
jgi:trypsin